MEILDENCNRTDPEKIVVIKEEPPKTNGMGIAGFVVSLLTLLGCWVPILNWIMWFLGFLFSIIGIFKKPRGFAIAGLCISLVTFIIIIALLGLIMAFIKGCAD